MDARKIVLTFVTMAVATTISGSLFAESATASSVVDDLHFQMDFRFSDEGVPTSLSVGNALSATSVCVVNPTASGAEPLLTNLTFAHPYFLDVTNVQTCLCFSQPTSGSGSDLKISPSRVDFPGAAVSGQTITFYSRFRFDGLALPIGSTDPHWLVLNGFNWGVKSGWAVGFVRSSAQDTGTDGTVYVMVPQKNVKLSQLKVKQGEWYDLFVQFSPSGAKTHVKVALSVPEPERRMSDGNGFLLPSFHVQEADVDAPIGTSASYPDLQVGSQFTSETAQPISSANTNYGKVFRGAVAGLMVWSRLLTDDEMTEVAGGYFGAHWAIGAKNGSADEFATAGNGEDVFRPGAMSWSTMRGVLTQQNPTLCLRGALRSGEANLPKVLVVEPLFTDVGTQCPVAVSVNSSDVGVFDLKTIREIYIPGKYMVRDSAGEVTISLTRVGNAIPGALAIDAMRFCGSWQVGVENTPPNNAEMATQGRCPKTYCVGDPSDKHVFRALHSSLYNSSDARYTNLMIKVWVPAETAKWNDCLYETTLCQQSDLHKGEIGVVLTLNGNEIWRTEGFSDGLLKVSVPIPAGTLLPGMNTFEWRNTHVWWNSTWMSFDYHRMTVKKRKQGLIFVVR